MIDVSILRRKPEERLRTLPIFGGEETITVLYCGSEEHRRIREVASLLISEGWDQDSAYNAAYGRVSLIGWAGLMDGEESLPVNDENKDLLMLGSAEIRRLVINGASSIKVDAEKN